MGERKAIRFRTSLRTTVLDVMRSRGWRETESEIDWDFFWADVSSMREVFDHLRLDDHQRVNHFRNHSELTRKDLMVKNLKRMRKALEKSDDKAEEAKLMDFFPPTYCLPQDYGMLEVDFKRHPTWIWIMKPPAKAQGKGIFLFTKMSQIADWRREYKSKVAPPASGAQGGNGASAVPATTAAAASQANGSDVAEPYLAQRYVDNPHLIGGKKYDLRIYVLVTSYAPLTVWLYRSGFARFCHHRFTLKDVENTFIHVTNVAVQKLNPKYVPRNGCKWGLRNLRQYLSAQVGEIAACGVFNDIQAMLLRTLWSVQKVILHDKHCTELYGYDVMLDDQLHPILIETNASPSLTAETPADYHLKFNLLEDYFNVLDLEQRLTGQETRIGGFDLIWKGGPIGVTTKEPRTTLLQSYLGCLNEHEIPMSRMRLPPRLAGMAGSERPLT